MASNLGTKRAYGAVYAWNQGRIAMKVRGALISALLVAQAFALAQDRGVYPFIPRPARTAEGLAKQVESNPIYMDRFVRHFQMTPREVGQMLRSLRLVRLEEEMHVEIFNAPATGVIRSRKVTLKKGTEVWVDASGVPVLKASCANPLTRTDDASEPILQPDKGVMMDVKEMGAAGAVVAPPTTQVVEPMAPVLPDVKFEATPAGGEMKSRGSDAAPFVGLGLLPTLLVGLHGGGSNVIPEPSTLLALGTGLAVVAARIKRRRPR